MPPDGRGRRMRREMQAIVTAKVSASVRPVTHVEARLRARAYRQAQCSDSAIRLDWVRRQEYWRGPVGGSFWQIYGRHCGALADVDPPKIIHDGGLHSSPAGALSDQNQDRWLAALPEHKRSGPLRSSSAPDRNVPEVTIAETDREWRTSGRFVTANAEPAPVASCDCAGGGNSVLKGCLQWLSCTRN